MLFIKTRTYFLVKNLYKDLKKKNNRYTNHCKINALYYLLLSVFNTMFTQNRCDSMLYYILL